MIGTILMGAALASGPSAPALAPAQDHFTVQGPTVVHDDALAGARTTVRVHRDTGAGTFVQLSVRGLPEELVGRRLGAHVHQNACGTDPAAAGPHHQNPGAPASAPLHTREVWLDLTVTPGGTAHALAHAPWNVSGGSVVIHRDATDHHTGDAGARLACTTVPFTHRS